MDMTEPKYQETIMFGDYNFTLRADTIEELTEELEKIKPIVDKAREHIQQSGKSVTSATKVCPDCGKELKLRNGKKGQFWGCTGYPDCRYTEQVKG
jgi:DNA repair exonuclease SbcCD ATPase subunit